MWVKVCGLTRLADAEMCVAAGVDAIGLNFWPKSSRFVSRECAGSIARAVRGRVQVVGLFVDAPVEQIREVRDDVGLDLVQLHGEESPALLTQLLPHAFKALRVRDAGVLEQARRYAGEHILLDAFVPGSPGGTGATFDWQLARSVVAERKVILAGGLTPENVGEAVREVRPYGVDTASGVEHAPGVKDEGLVQRFVTAARARSRPEAR